MIFALKMDFALLQHQTKVSINKYIDMALDLLILIKMKN